MTTGDANDAAGPLELIATAASGTEAVVKRELAALGYAARTVTPGRLLFRGDAAAICRTNLWLRAGERVLIQLGSFPATDFGVLFDGTAALAWEQWLPRDAEFPVHGRSHRSQLSSVPACQRIVKRAIVERLRTAYHAEELPETGPRCAIEISLRDDVATLTLDTTGVGLHKRGYRRLVGEAQLRETLAAVLVQLSFWRPGRVLADPFCGTGTIPIEAALIGRNIAPGLHREFAAEAWPTFDARNWQQAREEARDLVRPPLDGTAVGLRHRSGSARASPVITPSRRALPRTFTGNSGRSASCGRRPSTAASSRIRPTASGWATTPKSNSSIERFRSCCGGCRRGRTIFFRRDPTWKNWSASRRAGVASSTTGRSSARTISFTVRGRRDPARRCRERDARGTGRCGRTR